MLCGNQSRLKSLQSKPETNEICVPKFEMKSQHFMNV